MISRPADAQDYKLIDWRNDRSGLKDEAADAAMAPEPGVLD